MATDVTLFVERMAAASGSESEQAAIAQDIYSNFPGRVVEVMTSFLSHPERTLASIQKINVQFASFLEQIKQVAHEHNVTFTGKEAQQAFKANAAGQGWLPYNPEVILESAQRPRSAENIYSLTYTPSQPFLSRQQTAELDDGLQKMIDGITKEQLDNIVAFAKGYLGRQDNPGERSDFTPVRRIEVADWISKEPLNDRAIDKIIDSITTTQDIVDKLLPAIKAYIDTHPTLLDTKELYRERILSGHMREEDEMKFSKSVNMTFFAILQGIGKLVKK